MDMDTGRERHPSMILASQWPKDPKDNSGDDETFFIRLPDVVARNQSMTYGVFPGEHHRTTICQILPLPAKRTLPSNGPLLKQFGPNFELVPARFDAERAPQKVFFGPGLVTVMDWFRDPQKDEEVCSREDGGKWNIYMSFNRQKNRYRFHNLN